MSDWEALDKEWEALDQATKARMRQLCEQAFTASDGGGEVTVTIVLREREIVEMGWKCKTKEA